MANFSGEKKILIVGIAVSILLIGVGFIRASMKAPAHEEAAPRVAGQAVAREVVPISVLIQEKREAQRVERARAAIAEHEAAIEKNWRGEDTPDRIMAMGNLYQYQLKDTYSAINSYRSLIGHFPDHDKVPQAYVEIAHCHEKMGEEDQAKYVYQEMVENLDPTLQHTQYAKMKLGQE